MTSETATRRTLAGWSDPFGACEIEEATMKDRRCSSNASESRRGRSRGRRSTSRRDDDVGDASLLADLDASLLTDEERALAEAHEAAEEKVKLYREAAKLAIFAVPLLIFIPFLGFIVLFFGGMKVARRAYRLFYEPRLRERLIGDEVRKRVKTTVTEERRQLEGEHARSLEKLSASIAHEIRNPITAAKSLVQQMGEEPAAGENVEYARIALQELSRVEKSISHLLRYAREEEMRASSIQMADVLDSALETFRDRAGRNRVEIVRQFDSSGGMLGDAEQLRRVVINLVGNAMDAVAASEREKKRILVAMGENLAGSEVWVRIEDNGPGMDEEQRDRIFNPFFTSKEHGTGLGLAIVKRIVEAHGGSIELSSRIGAGTEFVLSFPKDGPGRGGS
jgi:signal transduction histidine kinase